MRYSRHRYLAIRQKSMIRCVRMNTKNWLVRANGIRAIKKMIKMMAPGEIGDDQEVGVEGSIVEVGVGVERTGDVI